MLWLEGLAYAAVNRPEDAVDALYAASTRGAAEPELLYQLARAQQAAGQTADAAATAQPGGRRRPRSQPHAAGPAAGGARRAKRRDDPAVGSLGRPEMICTRVTGAGRLLRVSSLDDHQPQR